MSLGLCMCVCVSFVGKCVYYRAHSDIFKRYASASTCKLIHVHNPSPASVLSDKIIHTPSRIMESLLISFFRILFFKEVRKRRILQPDCFYAHALTVFKTE